MTEIIIRMIITLFSVLSLIPLVLLTYDLIFKERENKHGAGIIRFALLTTFIPLIIANVITLYGYYHIYISGGAEIENFVINNIRNLIKSGGICIASWTFYYILKTS